MRIVFNNQVFLSTFFGVIIFVLTGCQTINDPKYNWYWAEHKSNSGVVNNSVERATFSGPDYIAIRHKPVPLTEPIPNDVMGMAERYCKAAGKVSKIREFGRYDNSTSFQCTAL